MPPPAPRGSRPTTPRRARPAARDHALAALIFVLATFALSYPLGVSPAGHGRFDNGDARLNAWALSWVSHQIGTDPARLFQAHIFHPLPNSLAFSEHLVVPALAALPLLQATNDLVLTYNLVTLGAILVSALGMYALVFALTGSLPAALLAGFFYGFCPSRFDQLPHLQMQLYGFLPLTLWSLHRFSDGRSAWHGPAAALFFVLQALSGTYLAAMAAVAVLVWAAVMIPGARLAPRRWAPLALSFVAAGGLLYAFARPYLWVNRTLGIEWDLEGIGSLSARPINYFSSSSRLYGALSSSLLSPEQASPALFPGLTVLMLASAGVWLLLRQRGGFTRPRAQAAAFLLITAAGVLVSLGPNGPLHPILHQHIVFFRGLRALSRFSLLVTFGLSILAGFAAAWLFHERGSPRRWWWRALAVGAFWVAESTGVPYRLPPFRDQPPPVYPWLAAHGKPGPILELPFRVIDTQYMFWARHHGFRPTVNGDSGFIPASHQWMQILLRRFPSADSSYVLQRLGVRYVIVHLGAYREGALVRLLNGMETRRGELVPVGDFGRDLLFEVNLRGRDAPLEHSSPLPARGDPGTLFDGDRRSVWQAPAEVLVVEARLAEPADTTGLRIFYGRAPRMPAGRIEVAVPGADGEWLPIFATAPDWPAVGELALSLAAAPYEGMQQVSWSTPVRSAGLRVRITGFEGPPELAEVTVLGKAPRP